MKKEKQDIITFKVPESLIEAMKGIHNRSEFIRTAVVAALNSVCPLCRSTGVIMPDQRPHLQVFLHDHHLEECKTCNSVHLVCEHNLMAPSAIHEAG